MVTGCSLLDGEFVARQNGKRLPCERLAEENAELREERDTYRDLVGMMDHPDLNVQLQAENAKLRELVARMARVLRADGEWTDPFYCNPYCADQFRCRSDDCVEVLCPIVKSMRELGVSE